MKQIIAKTDFILNGKSYIKDDEIKNLSYKDIVKLNEIGFINPLDYKDLVLLKRELNKSETKEENKNGTAL